MCDTMVVPPPATTARTMLFAKNSDRERNEAQAVELIAAADHEPGAELRCTYIAIPQARRTLELLACRPFWMWGVEMGANEAGVVIGNEAVHAFVPAARRRALTGMDLVRLGLERGASAAEALETITTLLGRHGQGGDCGYRRRFYYHNSFLIADRREAFVLETVGRSWAVERANGARAISNALSIGIGAERLSADLAARGSDFDFAAELSDRTRDEAGRGTIRRRRAEALMGAVLAGGRRIGAADLMAILRDHGPRGAALDWSPDRTVDRTLCMHAGVGERRGQTVGSLVSELDGQGDIHWVTGSSAPCLSVFKPVVLGGAPPWPAAAEAVPPSAHYDPRSRWWRGEPWRRAALDEYPATIAAIESERGGLEAAFRARMRAAKLAGEPAILRNAARACWREADAAESRWARRTVAGPRRGAAAPASRRGWAAAGRAAGLPSTRACVTGAPRIPSKNNRVAMGHLFTVSD